MTPGIVKQAWFRSRAHAPYLRSAWIFHRTIILLFAFPITQAYAGEETWYSGVGASRSSITGEKFETKVNSTGYKAYLGYKFSKHDAIEAAYVHFGEVDAKGGAGFSGSALQFNWMFFVPVTRQFRLSAGFGAHRWQMDVENSKFAGKGHGNDFSYSFGFEGEPVRNVGFRVEYENFQADTTKVNQSGISVFLKF